MIYQEFHKIIIIEFTVIHIWIFMDGANNNVFFLGLQVLINVNSNSDDL